LAREPQLPGRLRDRLGARAGIHAARVARDLYLPLHQLGEDPLHQRDEVLRVSQGRVAGLLFLHDGHRHFGEVVEHQVVDGPADQLAIGRLQPVTPKTLSSSHAYHGLGHRTTPLVAPITTRRSASDDPGIVTRASSRGRNPSGSVGGFRSLVSTAERPPATTATGRRAPPALALSIKNRTRTVACQGSARSTSASAGNSSMRAGAPATPAGTSNDCRPIA